MQTQPAMTTTWFQRSLKLVGANRRRSFRVVNGGNLDTDSTSFCLLPEFRRWHPLMNAHPTASNAAKPKITQAGSI